jgi:hypothetical protein
MSKDWRATGGRRTSAGRRRLQGRSAVLHVHYVMGRVGHRRGEDISWPTLPTGAVSCTACALCQVIGRTGHRRLEDMSWPSSAVAVSCTACVLCHRAGGPPEGGGHHLAVIAYRGISCTAFVLCHRAGHWRGRTSAGRHRLQGRSAVLHWYYVIGRAGHMKRGRPRRNRWHRKKIQPPH